MVEEVMEPGPGEVKEDTEVVRNEDQLTLVSVGIVRDVANNQIITGYNITEPHNEAFIRVNPNSDRYNELIRKITPDENGVAEFEGVVHDPMLEA